MNSTANASSTESGNCSTILSSTASKIGRNVAICLIIVVSLAGNSLIITLVYKTPNLRKPINYFIAKLNMAFSDLLYLLLLVILYSFIFIKLKAQVHPGEHSSNIEQQRQRRNRNVLHMSIAIISVFVFCWVPFITNILIINYRSSFTYFSCSFWLYYRVTSYVAVANCAFNPIICFAFSSNYRLGLKRLVNNSTGAQQ